MASDYVQQVYVLNQALPFIITVALMGFSYGRDRSGRWGFELSTSLYLKWSWALQFFLWIIESRFQIVKAHPYNPSETAWVYPAEVAFWVFSLEAYIITYALLWERKIPALYWTVMMAVGFLPPAILVWFGQNTWPEVLASALLGAGLTVPLVCWMRYLMHPKDVSIMLTQRPWTWMRNIDTHLRSLEEVQRADAQAAAEAAEVYP